MLLFDQQGRLVDGTNAMTKHEALERLKKKEGGFKKPKKKVDGHKMMAVSNRPRPPCLPD